MGDIMREFCDNDLRWREPWPPWSRPPPRERPKAMPKPKAKKPKRNTRSQSRQSRAYSFNESAMRRLEIGTGMNNNKKNEENHLSEAENKKIGNVKTEEEKKEVAGDRNKDELGEKEALQLQDRNTEDKQYKEEPNEDIQHSIDIKQIEETTDEHHEVAAEENTMENIETEARVEKQELAEKLKNEMKKYEKKQADVRNKKTEKRIEKKEESIYLLVILILIVRILLFKLVF